MLPSDPAFLPPKKSLETERLSILIRTEQDYYHAFQTSSDEQLRIDFGIVTDQELQLQRNKVLGGLCTYRTSILFFHLKARDIDKVIGSISFHNWYPMHSRSEIGYALSEDRYKGLGYMNEAIAAVVPFGFNAMSLNRIEAFVHPENLPSIKIVERAGFKREGLLEQHIYKDGVPGDSIVYGLLRQQFISIKPGSGPSAEAERTEL